MILLYNNYQIIFWRLKMENQIDMDEELMEKLFQDCQKKIRLNQSQGKQQDKSRKKPAENLPTNKKVEEMEVQVHRPNKLKFKDLPQQIEMYLIQIYPFGKKLFMTGIMDNGQTLNIIANDLYKEIYFVLKDEANNQSEMSEKYLKTAEQEIRDRLNNAGLSNDQYFGEMVDMQYVFQIGEIPRNRRKYFKVRYSFKCQLHEEIEPDWEGQTYKYVIGTSYTALELLIINKGVKGPCWIKINKQLLTENHHNNVEVGLCADMKFPEQIQVSNRVEPPTVRVLSFSLKAIVPATITKKKYFVKDKDDLQIYSISYHYCDDYKVSIKDQKPKLIHRTYYLQEFGEPPSKQFVGCIDENQILARFQADILKYDPDFLICHDVSATLDTLICRLGKIDKSAKIKFGRLKLPRDVSKSNQTQRINTFIAGRLLVDTFFHAKDMVKCIEYDLQNMAEFARPGKKFTGISDEETRVFFNDNKPLALINKCREQSELTFLIMNHFQILQMTRQLSNICGNLWKRSLENKRAERNQFLIMHECKQRDLIIPDKFRKERGDQQEVEGKKKYQGGMVFEPEKGFYSDYILLLDFNSLYPSLIREYNVCFSIIERPKLNLQFYYKSKGKKKQKKQKTQMEEQNPEDDGLEEMFANTKACNKKSQWGFLPRLIDNIVEQRKACKKKMKKAANPAQFFILQIQQKCYKVVANSIYGCLGFSVSRFYSRPLAALITKKGRDSLLNAKDIVSKRGGVRVIYGDTDSLMIEPSNLTTDQDKVSEIDKLRSLKKIADEIKSQINKQYTSLQIDIDGIFKPLILLMKKKYVANKLTNFEDILIGASKEPKFSLQFKGIQIVRRDGCKLARDVQEDIIKILVKSEDIEIENRYQKIIDYFTQLKEDIVKKPLSDLLFSKQLSKKLKQYANADHLPHVKVAQDRVAAGQKQDSLINHAIFYLICKPKEDNASLAKNAYDMRTFKKSQQNEPDKRLQVDYDHYKSVVIEPIGRLLCNINDKIYDQLVDILEIPKHKVKNVREEDDNAYLPEQIGQSMGNNLKSKFKQFVKQIGNTVSCPRYIRVDEKQNKNREQKKIQCKNQIILYRQNNPSGLNLTCSKCQFNITDVIYNKIRNKMKQYEANYYNNRKRCRCTKIYDVTNIVPCCDLDKTSNLQKSQYSFKLHNFIYMVIDIIAIVQSSTRHKNNGNSYQRDQNYEQERKMNKITEMAQRFLTESSYEEVNEVFSMLKI